MADDFQKAIRIVQTPPSNQTQIFPFLFYLAVANAFHIPVLYMP